MGKITQILLILTSKSSYFGDFKIKNRNNWCQCFENKIHFKNEVILNQFQNYFQNNFHNVQGFFLVQKFKYIHALIIMFWYK